MPEQLEDLFYGGDLRMLLGTDTVIAQVRTQHDFDALFKLLFHHDRRIVMRAADAIEKITRSSPRYLAPHRDQILDLFKDHATIEVKWHLAQLVPRLAFDEREFAGIWARLKYWALNRNESKIVRVNALQALFELMEGRGEKEKKVEFRRLVQVLSKENIPSIDARVRRLRRQALQVSRAPSKIQPVN